MSNKASYDYIISYIKERANFFLDSISLPVCGNFEARFEKREEKSMDMP